MKLVALEHTEHTKDLVLTYEAKHSSAEEKTVLTFGVRLTVGRHGGCEATVVFDECTAETPQEVIERLAVWCERAGKAPKAYEPTLFLPL